MITPADNGLEIAVPDNGNISAEGNTVTIPYEIKGMNAGSLTQASVLIVDKEFTAGNTNDAGIMCCHALEGMTGAEDTFDLPAGCDPGDRGTGYFVFNLAENCHGMHESDYAGIPVPVNAPSR